MPSILIVHGYRIYFWSNELGEPIHVHIAKGNPSRNATKVWLTKAGGCVLAHNDGRIPSRDLRELMDIVSANHARIADAWCRFFHLDSPSYIC